MSTGPDPAVQDIFFASAASAVFDSLTQGSIEIQPLLTQITRAIDEGRLMYAPADDTEEALIAGTRIGGAPLVDNTKETVLGVYVNDITEGKLNYYTDLQVAAESDQCTADDPSFTSTATFTNTLEPSQVPELASYISPGRFFPKGVVSTDFVLYGPVGSSFVSATVDGEEVQAKSLPHLGSPAVKINVVNPPSTTSEVTATFAGGDSDFGPLEVRHTPMVRDTEMTIDTPGCDE